MGRVFTTDERVQSIRRRLERLVASTGSVRAACQRLNWAQTKTTIHPNRLHAALSDEPHRALNEASVEAMEEALRALDIGDSEVRPRPVDRPLQYHAGDIVRLQGGGPRLTVTDSAIEPASEGRDEVERVAFAWFTPDGVLHGGLAPAAALRQDTRRLTRRRRRR